MSRVVACVLALACGSSLAAQQSAAVTVSGFISDSASGRPLATSLVELRSPTDSRAAQSDASGGFIFRRLQPGTYHLSVRRIGYREYSADVSVSHDTTLTISLAAVVALDTTRVGASFVGIYGMVGESHTLRPIGNAKITVIGAGKSTSSDTAGAFAIETPHGGTFVVRITRDGYAEQRMDVTVPAHERVEIAPLLDTTSEKPSSVRDYVWNDFDRRLAFRGPGSTIVPAEELTRYAGGTLSDNIIGSASFVKRGLTLGPSICVFINGQPKPNWPLDAIDVSRVVAVELYTVGRGDATGILASEWPPKARCSPVNTNVTRVRPATDVYWAVIWLKA